MRAQELAARAGVGKGTLYRCFASKRELYLAAIIEGFAALQQRLTQALKEAASPTQKVALIARHTTEYFWDRRLFFVLLQATEPVFGPLSQGFYTERAKLSDMIRAALAEGVAAGELRADLNTRLCSEALLGMIRGVIRFRKSTDTPETSAKTVLELFFTGMTGGARRGADSRSQRKAGCGARPNRPSSIGRKPRRT